MSKTVALRADLENVRLFVRKGENDLHWYLRDIMLDQAKAHQIGMSEYLAGLKSGVLLLPACFLLEDWIGSVHDMYADELRQCMSSLTVQQIAQMDLRGQLVWVTKRLISEMYIQYGVKTK